MFKKISILIFYFYLNFSFSQSIICEYIFTPNIKYINEKIKSKDSSAVYKNININAFSNIKYILHHSNNNSIFFSSSNNLLFDNIEFSDNDIYKNTKISDFTSITFKDFKNKNSLQREYILDKKFIIVDSLQKYNWVVKNEIKNINGIECQLATTVDCFNNNIEAWFTLSVPISNGPSIYHDLPGLIIEINSKDFTFNLSKLKFFKKLIDIKFDEKGKNINQSDFVKLLNEKM